jgi:death-on-curing protein
MTEDDVEYLDLEDLLSLVRALRIGPVRDLGLLDSACARPRATAFGVDVYPTLEAKAASLFQSLARNHALVDGNKRLAWLAGVVFLRINGLRLNLDQDAAFRLAVEVAEGLLELDKVAARLGPAG